MIDAFAYYIFGRTRDRAVDAVKFTIFPHCRRPRRFFITRAMRLAT